MSTREANPPTVSRKPPAAVSEAERERSLRVSVVDGCFHGAMVGCGENFVGAYAVWLGATPALAAALGSWPALAGALVGVFAVDLVDRTRRRARICVTGAAVAGLVFFLLLALPIAVPSHAVLAAVACWVLYHVGNNVAGPAWNSWMGDLVPPERRGVWFGRRSALIAFVTLVALVAGGEVLNAFKARGHEARGWWLCLGLAGVFKLVSVWFLSRMAEPPYEPRTGDFFTLRQFLARSGQSNFAWFTFGIALMWFCVHLSGPFFALYQLKILGWTYREFMVSIAVQTLATVFTQSWWGRLGDRRGSRWVLVVSGVVCSILPGLWCFTVNYWLILGIQALGGFAWGGFNLATANFLFEAVTPPKRARCAAYFNLVTSLGVLGGAAAGAWIIDRVPESWGLASPFLAVFALSAILRLPVVVLWLGRVRDGEKAHVELRERARQLAVVVKGDPGEAL